MTTPDDTHEELAVAFLEAGVAVLVDKPPAFTTAGATAYWTRRGNFGDTEGAVVKVWNSRRSGYRTDADLVVEVPSDDGGHGGADPRLVAEFVDFVRAGGPTLTSPVAARQAVAAGCAATASLRADGVPVDVPALPRELADHFAGADDAETRES
ncbi:hypothetical protein GCM10010341_69930 [Streptomyces noursei]|nr:hypothetical protein GCM10010341_69930 [Streptomyces noursei]